MKNAHKKQNACPKRTYRLIADGVHGWLRRLIKTLLLNADFFPYSFSRLVRRGPPWCLTEPERGGAKGTIVHKQHVNRSPCGSMAAAERIIKHLRQRGGGGDFSPNSLVAQNFGEAAPLNLRQPAVGRPLTRHLSRFNRILL